MPDDLSYPEAFNNLKKYDDKVGALVLALYREVSETLAILIPDNEMGLREAQNKLMKEYDKALESTNFIEKWKASTVSTIVKSSFITNQPAPTKQALSDYLWSKSLFKDKVVLSARLRENSQKIVSAQRKALKTALKGGKTIAQITGNIGDDTLNGFTRDLPKYIDELKKVSLTQSFTDNKGNPIKVPGGKITPKQLSSVRVQIKKIKTPGLRADYLRLIDAIEVGENVDKAAFYAMERRTKFYANRVARSETIRAMAVARNHIAMQDPDTHFVKNVTQGSNPCPYCIAVSNLGFVPVENATISTHHSNCSCRAEYKRSIKKPKKWSNDTHNSRLQTEINKANDKAQKAGRSKTYIEPESPVNLRTNDLYRDYPKS